MFIPALLIVGACVLSADSAFARAGGGEGFGGGFGGGGGGEGEAIGLVIELLFHLCIHYPAIGIPLTIIVIVGFMTFGHFSKKWTKQANQSRVIHKAARTVDQRKLAKGLAALRIQDPNFDEIAFNARFQKAFHILQQAWSEQQLAPIRPFVSDGVFERFALQIDEQQALGYRNRMDDVRILGSRLVQVLSFEHFDQATFSIRAKAHDHRVDIKTGRKLKDHAYTEEFIEYWTFLRRAGVKTNPDKPGLIEGRCPNCGAGIEMNQHAKCNACGALLRSGEHDWVLTEITQAGEWNSAESRAELPGEHLMLQRDPYFNRQQLEDLVSVMFWRRVMAERRGTVDPLRAMASQEYAGRLQAELQPDAQGVRHFHAECAVGSVRTLGVLTDEDEGRDIALVGVRWSGTLMQRAERGRSRESAPKRIRDMVFILRRKTGATTRIEQLVSSAHCPACGGPESDVTALHCEYCGAQLNDEAMGWVLAGVEARYAPKVEQLLAQCRGLASVVSSGGVDSLSNYQAPSRQAALIWVIRMVIDDNVITDKERTMLNRLARHLEVLPDQLSRLIQLVRKGRLELPEPRNFPEARGWLEQVIDAALIDGNISTGERKLLSRVGEKHSLTDYDIKMVINQRRGMLYQEARRELREE